MPGPWRTKGSTDIKPLNGKVALVTGASSGIGAATALALAEQGARVVLAARRRERLEMVADRIEKAGGEFLVVPTDVARETEVRRLIDQTLATWNSLDILVNNAGLMLLAPVLEAQMEEWRRMVDVNIMGILYATHMALPVMVRQKSGHIINISSVAGRVPFVFGAVYCLCKFGLTAFTESLRQEVHGMNIRITLIEPGAVVTELRDHITNPTVLEAFRRRELRMLEAEDVARAIIYAVTQPSYVSVNALLVRPTEQTL